MMKPDPRRERRACATPRLLLAGLAGLMLAACATPQERAIAQHCDREALARFPIVLSKDQVDQNIQLRNRHVAFCRAQAQRQGMSKAAR